MKMNENNIQAVWQAVRSNIQERLGEIADTWLEDVLIRYKDEQLTIVAENTWRANILESRLLSYIKDSLSLLGFPNLTVKIISKDACNVDDQSLFVRMVMASLPGHRLLDSVVLDNTNYILTIQDSENSDVCVSAFWVTADCKAVPVSEYSTYIRLLGGIGRKESGHNHGCQHWLYI